VSGNFVKYDELDISHILVHRSEEDGAFFPNIALVWVTQKGIIRDLNC
jgi:hypothetical protein